jgi:hypothetical protein
MSRGQVSPDSRGQVSPAGQGTDTLSLKGVPCPPRPLNINSRVAT